MISYTEVQFTFDRIRLFGYHPSRSCIQLPRPSRIIACTEQLDAESEVLMCAMMIENTRQSGGVT